jgi:hypothetical protein
MKKRRGRKPLLCSPSVEAMLGVVTDHNIAKETGFSHITIAKWRRERGIATAPKAATKVAPRHRLFGLVPDAELAMVEGVSRQRVSQQRAKVGVPAPPYLATYMAWSLLLKVVDEGKVVGDSVTLPLELYRAISGHLISEP